MNIRPLMASALLAGLLTQNIALAAESDSWGFKKKAVPPPVVTNSASNAPASAGGQANGAADPGDEDRKFPAGLVMAIAVALAVATGGDGDSDSDSTTSHP